jgi:transposase-like protein
LGVCTITYADRPNDPSADRPIGDNLRAAFREVWSATNTSAPSGDAEPIVNAANITGLIRVCIRRLWIEQDEPVRLSTRWHPTSASRSVFARFWFPAEVITEAVRWYPRYGLSYRDVGELLAERGVEVDHVAVYRWVQRFTPLLANVARFAGHSPGDRWFVDETNVNVNGVWRCVYRAVDQHGQIIDVPVSKRPDGDAARRFFHRALTTLNVPPTEVVTDAPSNYGSLTNWFRQPGTTSNATPTTASRPITADSNTGQGLCEDYAPTAPLRSSSPDWRSAEPAPRPLRTRHRSSRPLRVAVAFTELASAI